MIQDWGCDYLSGYCIGYLVCSTLVRWVTDRPDLTRQTLYFRWNALPTCTIAKWPVENQKPCFWTSMKNKNTLPRQEFKCNIMTDLFVFVGTFHRLFEFGFGQFQKSNLFTFNYVASHTSLFKRGCDCMKKHNCCTNKINKMSGSRKLLIGSLYIFLIQISWVNLLSCNSFHGIENRIKQLRAQGDQKNCTSPVQVCDAISSKRHNNCTKRAKSKFQRRFKHGMHNYYMSWQDRIYHTKIWQSPTAQNQ